MNGILYGNTLSACTLEPDLDILPAGDATEIGEKVREKKETHKRHTWICFYLCRVST